MATRHFLTVQRSNKGPRGVFCSASGQPAVKDEPWTEEDMRDCLDVFWIVLDPGSAEMSEPDLARCTRFLPLAEYSKCYGIAFDPTEEAVPAP